MKSGHIDSLKQEVEKTFGRKVLSSSDCRLLCNDIYHQLKIKISFNTVRRFFNLIEAAHHPSHYTLDILTNYCGYPSYSDYLQFKEQALEAHEEIPNSDLLNYIILLFKNTEASNIIDITYYNLVQQTIKYLEHNSLLLDRFQRDIARIKNGQDFYYEQFVNIDKLNSFYGNGLQYYLNEKTSKEAQIFGHSLLCLKAYLINDNIGIEENYKKVVEFENGKTIQPSILGRYLATQLFFASAFDLDIEPILIKARQAYSNFSTLPNSCCYLFSFEIVWAEALILTQQYDEASYFIEENIRKNRTVVQSYNNIQLSETIKLFYAIIMANTGKKIKAKELLVEIDPNKFYFLSKQFLNILYLSLKQFLNKKNTEEGQILHLIQSTGFVRLSNLFSIKQELVK